MYNISSTNVLHKQGKDMTEDLLNRYTELGLTPIPLKGKIANYHWKDYQFNLRDFANPGINVGLRTGLLPSGNYLYVIDLDNKESLSTFWEDNHLPPDTPIVSTGRGFHFYLSWIEPVKTKHFPGMDIIANGYVVCPPSIHENGKPYRFIRPLAPSIPLFSPSPLVWAYLTPSTIVNPRNGCNRSDQTEGIHTHIPPGVPQGRRHSTLIRYLGILIATHFREDEALERAITWGRRCIPPLTAEEVGYAVRTAWGKWDLFEG